jgi:hypothetical protein
MKTRMITKGMINFVAFVLALSMSFLVPKAAAQSDKYPKMAPVPGEL